VVKVIPKDLKDNMTGLKYLSSDFEMFPKAMENEFLRKEKKYSRDFNFSTLSAADKHLPLELSIALS
jgi:hypothetical protein